MLRTVLASIEDDTEEAPWMVMGTPQSDATSDFYVTLRTYARSLDPPIFVATMLPIRFRPNPPDAHIEQLAPDVMVARVPSHDRSSYTVEREGVAPCFVLEVISPESRRRDTEDKPAHYERMGVDEYALFTPASGRRDARLQGYRRDRGSDSFVPWEPDERGWLWSESLGVWVALRDQELRLQRADGAWLRTHAESEAERLAAQAARGVAEAERLVEQASREAAETGWKREVAAREREHAAREAAEAEVARLRAELERRDQR